MTDIAAARPAAPPRTPVFSNAYKGVVLSFLLAAYTFNFIDRTIIATIGQAIKIDLKLTDLQLGLLGGLSFAVLYTLLGIPIARLAERFNRGLHRLRPPSLSGLASPWPAALPGALSPSWRCGWGSAWARQAARRRRTP